MAIGLRSKICLGVTSAILIALGIQTYRVQSKELYISEYKQEIQQHLVDSYTKAMKVEREAQRTINSLGREYQRKLNEARENERAIADSLRNDTIRLRSHWRGCEATSRVSSAAASGSVYNGEAELRNESASRIIGDSDRADAQVRALQDTINSYLQIINGNPYY